MGMGSTGRQAGQDRTGQRQTAWEGMDACTLCGEAIPVVWARNTGDPACQVGTHTHTHKHTHLTQQIRAQSPRVPGPQEARRQTSLHLED